MRVLIIGYRNYELGIFNHKQEEVTVLKSFLKLKIIEYIENGAEWFIVQNYPGIDMYAGEVLKDLKEIYDFKYIVLKPFYNYDERFKDEDKLILQEIENEAEFSSYIFKRPYENPSMFKEINHFLTDNSSHALIFYDEESESNLKYIYRHLLEKSSNSDYNIERIQFDDLNDFISYQYDN